MLDELKKFVILHAKSQGIALDKCLEVLNNITIIAGSDKGSWVYEFSRKGNEYALNKNHLMALQFYILARFPFIDSIEKEKAHQHCIYHFRYYCQIQSIPIQKRSILYSHARSFYYLIKNKMKQAPLLIIMGGIISVKEQWHNLIAISKKFNFHLVLSEMPGVGENKIIYTPQSYAFISEIINSLSYLGVTEAHMLAMSFSGHLALKAAVYDKRIKSIFTVGAPVYNFFIDKEHWKNIPIVTKHTLAHLLKCNLEDLAEKFSQFSISKEELKKISIPICYINSLKDEVIAQSETNYLAKNLLKLTIIDFNDEHGSPNYLGKIKLAFLNFLLSHRSNRPFISPLLKLLNYFVMSKYHRVIS